VRADAAALDRAVAALPDDPALQSILAAGIALKVAQRLEYANAVEVRSLQTVSFATESLEDRPTGDLQASLRDPRAAIAALPNIILQVEVESKMRRDSMRATFKRPSDRRPQMILELMTKDGKRMFQETHWYSDRQAYLRGDLYSPTDPSGVEELKIDHALWAEVQAQGAPVCALADFFYTWIGWDSLWVRGTRSMLARATTIKVERRDGGEVFVLTRPCHDDRDGPIRSIRTDQFVVTKDFRFIGWSSEHTHAKAGAAAKYMVIDRRYEYFEEDE
jgi:hypothetical protein